MVFLAIKLQPGAGQWRVHEKRGEILLGLSDGPFGLIAQSGDRLLDRLLGRMKMAALDFLLHPAFNFRIEFHCHISNLASFGPRRKVGQHDAASRVSVAT
jgi:hypothetical protein